MDSARDPGSPIERRKWLGSRPLGDVVAYQRAIDAGAIHALHNLVGMHEEQGETGQAIHLFSTALDLDANDILALNNLA